MSEIARWGMALAYMACLWGFAAFLIYKQVPGWGWFLLCVTIIMGTTSVHIDSSKKKPNLEQSVQAEQPPQVQSVEK